MEADFTLAAEGDALRTHVGAVSQIVLCIGISGIVYGCWKTLRTPSSVATSVGI
jgi:hypothetical protein